MTETLLSTSNVLLFGREVKDLIIAGTDIHVASCKVEGSEYDEADESDDEDSENDDPNGDEPSEGAMAADNAGGGRRGGGGGNGGGSRPPRNHNPSPGARRGQRHWLSQQLERRNSRIARIYGFSYEGAYYDLPRPVLFLVHGEGKRVTLAPPGDADPPHPSRAPAQPSIGGVSAADFEFADDIRVWSYDKADYTIRMDVETGMLEQVLLDACFGDGWDGPSVSGGRVSGGRVAGGRVSGGRVSGGRVSGGRVGGPRGRGDPTD